MTHCSGCGSSLSWKKYKFHRMWRIPGYYCKECMFELGKDFDKHGRVVRPKQPCDLCSVEFYFLQNVWENKKQKHYCKVCSEAVSNGVIPAKGVGPAPKKLPQVMMIFAGLGVLMMVLGLMFTLMTAGGEQSLANIMFGAVTTALGFVLFKKTVKSRNLLVGKKAQTEAVQ